MNEAKAYLKQIQGLDKAIQRKVEEIERLKQCAVSTSVSLNADRVQTSGCGDKFETCILMAADLEKEVDQDIDRFYDLKMQCVRMITDIDDECEERVLFERYVNYKNMSEISDLIGKSLRQTQRIHGNALHSFTEKYFLSA